MKFAALVTSVLLIVLVLSDLPRPTLARRSGLYCGKSRKGQRCNSNVNFIKRIFGDDKRDEETDNGAFLKTEADREIEENELVEKLRLLRDLLRELQQEQDLRLLIEDERLLADELRQIPPPG
ncbi:uncharacterized protein LOC117304979 [Asterias rubens]|uniref:uncharacterized protein LOC117304979 n=1 Tax=Asterias rubens TaxID=7604 RepID=UPI0014559AAF|nr:uncharacterized protein LOC117304979 [Asterias rubens]